MAQATEWSADETYQLIQSMRSQFHGNELARKVWTPGY